MNYVFASYVRHEGEEGLAPDLPTECSFLNLVSPRRAHRCAVFVVGGDPDELKAKGVEFVPAELRTLLVSAELYPPAMALARHEIERKFADHEPGRVEFVEAYSKALRHHLRSQPEAGYVLVEAVEDEVGYIERGDFLWVIEYLPKSDRVHWVSGDYFVYTNPAHYFALSANLRRRLTRTQPNDPSTPAGG